MDNEKRRQCLVLPSYCLVSPSLYFFRAYVLRWDDLPLKQNHQIKRLFNHRTHGTHRKEKKQIT